MTTIQVSKGTYERLLEAKAKAELREKRRYSMNDIIKELLDVKKET